MQGINEIPDEGNRHSDQGLANKEIHLDFQTFVHNGIKKLDKGSVVASLEYKKNNKKHKIEFIFGGFNKGHGEIINPKIEIKINKNSCVVPSRAKFEKSNHSLKFRSNGINGWQMIKLKDSEVGDLENPLTIDEEKIDLPSVNKTDENFLSFWFNTPQKKLGKGSVETIERVRPIGVDTEYSSMWDCIEVNGTTVTIKDFPQLPDYNSEKTVFVNNRELDVEWARFFIVVIVWRIILSTLMVEKQDEDSDNSRKHIGSRKDCSESFAAALFNFLPPTSDYRPKRPVDINPHAVSDALMAEKLEVPWHVISSATAALNAGKHIIFTGPPGCGKTHLARLISQIGSAKSPLMSTASQAWSTDEVIGKYMPNVEGTGLEFKYGFFLRALKSHQWLVIDEINRCDIDNCFGELFTVLSGQSVSIPFEKKSDEGIFKPIRIDVGGDSEETDKYESIKCSETFRLLATMNDADIAGLHQLSYALRRRFAIIRVDAPADEKKQTIFKNRIESVFEALELEDKKYTVINSRENCKKTLTDQIKNLFARPYEEDKYEDLIDLGVVGIAPVLDIIRFVCEGLRAPDGGLQRIDRNFKSTTEANATKAEAQLLNSFLAMGLVLNVFPQLDAIAGEDERFKDALKCILSAFDEKDVFLRIERKAKEKKFVLELVGTPNLKDKPDQTIRDFLVQELRRQYLRDDSTLGLIAKVASSLQNNKTEKTAQ